MKNIFDLAKEEQNRQIDMFKSLPEDVVNAEEARRQAKFEEEQARSHDYKMEELEKFYEANRTQIFKDVAWEVASMKRTQTEDSWIHYEEEGPAICISLDEGEYRAVLYYTFYDLSAYKVL